MRSLTRLAAQGLGIAVLSLLAGCERMALVAPSNSTVTVTTSSTVVAPGGTAEITAFVAEQSGTPVHNGTMVRFSADLGRLDPAEAQTRNGYATTTFHAGDTSGLANIRAMSGGSGAGSGGGTDAGTPGAATPLNSNVVQISVGAAAVETVVVRANPTTVPFTGGSAELVATVVARDGRAVSGVPVSFSSTHGQLSSTRSITDTYGEGRSVLVLGPSPGAGAAGAAPTASVTATAGVKTSEAVTIGWQAADPLLPNVVLEATADATTAIGHRWTFTATVTYSAPSTPPSLAPVRYEWDFGNGVTESTNGNSTSYVYTGNDRGSVRRVRVTVHLANGESVSSAVDIIVLTFP